MDITDAAGFPDSTHIESASPHEVKLLEATTVYPIRPWSHYWRKVLTTAMELMNGSWMSAE